MAHDWIQTVKLAILDSMLHYVLIHVLRVVTHVPLGGPRKTINVASSPN